LDNKRFAVVGLGHIGKKHFATIQAHPGAEVVALCDNDTGGNAHSLAVPYYPSIEALAQADFDCASICTPNGLHAAHAIALLKAGKHVLIEKPMALSKKDCESIIHTALNHGKMVFCVMQNRYAPLSQWLKENIDGGTLGEVFMLQINCFWNRDAAYYGQNDWRGSMALDGGILFTQFAHFVDMLYWVFGEVSNIRSAFRNFAHQGTTDFPDTGSIFFDLANGGMGSLQVSTAVHGRNFESSITVMGSKGTVKIAGQNMDKLEYVEGLSLRPPTLAPSLWPNHHHYVIQNVMDALSGEGQIATNALEGMKVVEMIEQMQRF
jgi:UDP-N-acetyl-2-amino-2-deoxyglucuronate dehydrogenase